MSRNHGKVVAVIQARLESRRLPAKVLLPLGNGTVLSQVYSRVLAAKSLDQVVVAVPDNEANGRLRDYLNQEGIIFCAGSAEDVLGRYLAAARASSAEIVVRITADCPLIDPAAIDLCVTTFLSGQFDYVRTSDQWPDGLDVEVFSAASLLDAYQNTASSDDREHVTPYIARRENSPAFLIDPPGEVPEIRLTLDYQEDYDVVSTVWEHLGSTNFNLRDISELARQQPAIFVPNRQFARNEGALMNSGEKLYARAKNVISGGAMLLSKRPEMHTSRGWPSYFDRAAGCHIWDLDGVRYTDVGWMGIGTNILGYAHPEVDEAVKRVIEKGNLSTLNAPEEVELAELLCELHPWADMARFTRSGGEAGAVAVRIARASSGRDHVAFCGYHGWHDWYLAANLGNVEALDGHLLPGLEPRGVPRALKGTSSAFEFNNLESLTQVVEENSSGVIFMEVERTRPPTSEFLQGARDLASKTGAVLVFDECTSGFRSILGGQHLKYGVNPDIVVLGKTLGNGYAINAVVGTRDVMQSAHKTFISSTFWTERIGSAAALAAVRVMEKNRTPENTNLRGEWVQQKLVELGSEVGLKLSVTGIPALTSFSIEGSTPPELRTLITQEMLTIGFLAGTSIYLSEAHTEDVLLEYFEALKSILGKYSELIAGGKLSEALPNGLIQEGFSRLA